MSTVTTSTPRQTQANSLTVSGANAYPAPASLVVPTDLTTQGAQAITETLNPIIADLFALYLKTKNYHWHLAGPHFRDYHLLFDEQADQIFAATDQLAERVRKVGGSTIRSIGHISQLQTITDDNQAFVAAQEMVGRLMRDNHMLASSMRAAHERCEQARDYATASILEVLIDEAERRTWFLFEVTQEGDPAMSNPHMHDGMHAGQSNGHQHFEPQVTGLPLLADPELNRGTAFTMEERKALDLVGLLPSAVTTLNEQAKRAYAQYLQQPTDLAKNVFMTALHDRNEVLFYRLLTDHLQEMLPIVYDPTVAQAIEQYSHEYRRPRGVYLSIDDPGAIEQSLRNAGLGADDVDLIVATDAQEILGIGDWGVGGMDISVGKLAVYTAAAGIDPGRVIPVMLDVGTNRESLLTDPTYLGNRHARATGKRYDDFIDAYVQAATKLFPNALLHWEDFGPSNGRRILEHYRSRICTFNDDMQGTGAIALAGILSAMKVSGLPWREQRVVIFGSGTAGIGNADQIRAAMMAEGMTQEEATQHFWCVDIQGLLLDTMGSILRDFQVPYARHASEVNAWQHDMPQGGISLAEVVRQVHPTMLIGTSTAPGTFTQAIVQEMAAHTERPIIFPLSNPTELMEASASDLITWTDGRALVATGIPSHPVTYKGITYAIGQANNALLYPGLGLGAIVARASRISDGMFMAAAKAVAGLVNVQSPGASLLPQVDNLRTVSATVAVEVARQAQAEGVARAPLGNIVQHVEDAMWQPVYPKVLVGQGARI